jgi:hypothetical protein
VWAACRPHDVAGVLGSVHDSADRWDSLSVKPQGCQREGLSPWLVLGALVSIVPLIFLGLNRIVAHPFRVIPLLSIMLTLLLVGHGLRTAHLEAPFTLIGRGAVAKRRNA